MILGCVDIGVSFRVGNVVFYTGVRVMGFLSRKVNVLGVNYPVCIRQGSFFIREALYPVWYNYRIEKRKKHKNNCRARIFAFANPLGPLQFPQ